MFILRLILVVLAVLFVRRLVRGALAPSRRGGPRPPAGDGDRGRGYGDLTQQDVSDADYEEIP